MDPRNIIFQYYQPDSQLADRLIAHSEAVRNKALVVARRIGHLKPDLQFISEASMLHDVGIIKTSAARIGCYGHLPYVCHGVEGRKILESHGLSAHALVCERHVGVGLTKTDILQRRLPLPLRDMLPETLEETIICYADEFFSKTEGMQQKSVEAIVESLKPYGHDKVRRFKLWHQRFNPPKC
jgi:uncharacterized protein